MQMTKKVLSIVLAVMMVVSMMTVMAVASVNAAFSTDTMAVFFTDSNGWDTNSVIYVHYWKDGTEDATSWPGVGMTYLYDNSMNQSVYGAIIPDDADRIIFNANGQQTSAISSRIYGDSWWYADSNNDAVYIQRTKESGSLNANFAGDYYYALDGHYYDASLNAIQASDLAVAEVNGTQYVKVNDAVAAAGEGGEVKLIADIKGNVGIDGDYTTTLDLNGHTITVNGGSGITLYTKYNGGKTFTIKDSSAAQTGAINITKRYAGDACISDSSGRKVVIEGGTYTSDANALYVSSDEGWTINGGTFNGNINVLSDVEITGGTVNGSVINAGKPDYSTPYPWTNVPAEIEISGGTFSTDVSAYTTVDTYQNANGEVVAKAANTIYDDGDFAKAAAEGGDWYIVADVDATGVTVTSNLKIWNTDKDHTVSGDFTVANGASIAKGGKKKVTFTGTVTLNGGSVSSANFTNIVVANDPYVSGQISNVPSGAVVKNADGDRIVYDAISLAYAAKSGSEVYLVDDIADMYMNMNVNSGNFILHGNGHTVNFTFSPASYASYAAAIGKGASIAIDDLNVTVASGKTIKSFIKANDADDNTGSVSIDGVSAAGFSTADVYTGGGDWTFANATVTSATEPACPEGWEAVDNNDGTWTIVAHVHAYTTSSFNWTQDSATGDWDCDTLTLSCSCGDSQDYAVTGFFGASAVTVTANADGSFTYSVSKKVDGVTYSDTKTNAADGVVKSSKQLTAAAKKGGSWELGADIDGAVNVVCADGFVLDGKDHTVTRNANVSTNPVFRTNSNPAEVTLKNLTIDGIADQVDSKPAIATQMKNPSAGNVINLENVTITNYDFDQDNNGVVLAWGQATVNMTNCNVATDSTYDVWGGAASHVNVSGGTVGTAYLNGGSAEAAITNGATVNNVVAFNGNTITTDDPSKITVPADYKLQDNGNGSYTVVAKTYVAQIGSTKYETIGDAIEAAQDGDTIEILDDVNIGANWYRVNKDVTFDLGGNTVTGNDSFIVVGPEGDVTIKNGTVTSDVSGDYVLYADGNLTIADDAIIKATAARGNGVIVRNGGMLDVEGTIESGYYSIAGFGSAVVNVYDGASITSTDASALSGNGSSGAEGYTFNVMGGTLTSINDVAIYHPNQGDLNISGGQISGKTAIYIKSGATDISGAATAIDNAIITGTGAQADMVHSNNGCNATGDAIVIENCGYPGGTPDIDISGGTITSTNAEPVASYGYSDYEPVKNFISGGSFNKPVPADYCAPGFVPAPMDPQSGMYTVIEHSLQDDADTALAAGALAGLTFVDDTVVAASDNAYAASLLGVQLRQDADYVEDQLNDGKSLRYIAAVDKTFLEGLDTYGFEIEVEKNGTTRTLTYPCMGSSNNVITGGKESNMEYFTMGLTGITDTSKILTVRFYVTKGAEMAYAKYTKANPADDHAIIASYDDVEALAH